MSDYLGDVIVDEGLGYKFVLVIVNIFMDMQFMNLVGVSIFVMFVVSVVEECIGGVEILMVLDVLGLMGWNFCFMNFKVVVKDFIDMLIIIIESGKLLILIVFYVMQVFVLVNLIVELNVINEYSFFNCVNFDEDDFEEIGFDFIEMLECIMYFSLWSDYDGCFYDLKCFVSSLVCEFDSDVSCYIQVL